MTDAGLPYLVAAYMLVVMVLFCYMLFLDLRQRRLRNEVEKLQGNLSTDQAEQKRP